MDKKEKIIKSKDLIKETLVAYKKNVLKFIEIFIYGIIGAVPFLVVVAVSMMYIQFLSGKVSLWVNIIFGLVAFVSFLVSLYFAIIYNIRAKVASILLIKNNFSNPKDNFNEAQKMIFKFLTVSVLMMVLIIAWGFVFVIPALIFAIYYGFSQFTLVVENKRPFSAVERSYDLVKGYFWPVLGRLLLISVLGFLVYSIISLPLSWLEEKSLGAMIYGLVVNVIWAFLSPYFIIYFYNIYKSLKETNK